MNYKGMTISAELTNSRGRYIISVERDGVAFKADTTDAELYDKIRNWENASVDECVEAAKSAIALTGADRKIVDVVAYKQGGQWMANIDGNVKALHWSVESKRDVIEWFADESDNEIFYNVEFDD